MMVFAFLLPDWLRVVMTHYPVKIHGAVWAHDWMILMIGWIGRFFLVVGPWNNHLETGINTWLSIILLYCSHQCYITMANHHQHHCEPPFKTLLTISVTIATSRLYGCGSKPGTPTSATWPVHHFSNQLLWMESILFIWTVRPSWIIFHYWNGIHFDCINRTY